MREKRRNWRAAAAEEAVKKPLSRRERERERRGRLEEEQGEVGGKEEGSTSLVLYTRLCWA
jgi:hypothetical protein